MLNIKFWLFCAIFLISKAQMENIEKTIVYWCYLSCHQKILTSKCGINERRATTLTHLFLFALLLTQSGDVGKNPGLIETIETVYGICSKNCANLKFVHLNFQSISRKRMQLKKFLDDMGENTIIGISETWLKKEDSDILWNLHPRTHAMFRYDRQSAVKKKKRWRFVIYTSQIGSEMEA